MTVFEFLKQPQTIKVQMEHHLSEIQQWDDLLYKIAAGKDVETSSEKAYAVNLCLAMEDTFLKLAKERATATEKVVAVITQLEDPAEKDLLLKLYVHGKTLREIAEDTGRTYSNIATIHGSAMKNVVAFFERLSA